MLEPRLFSLHRDRDISGVSGTGIVADGCAWPDGTVSIRWRGARPSTVSWNSIADAEAVHGHGGATRIVWADTARPPAGLPLVQGNCPACRGSNSLFLGDGGYVTCARLDCPNPDAATTLLEQQHPADPAPADRPAAHQGLVHAVPPDGLGPTPCCGQPLAELPLADRVSTEAPVTCPGHPAECGPECAEGHQYAYRCALKAPPVDPAAILGGAQQPPTIWIDGDPLMEAIAAAVWEHCHTEGTSTVRDDPRNIAAAAAHAVRQQDTVRTVPDTRGTPDTPQDNTRTPAPGGLARRLASIGESSPDRGRLPTRTRQDTVPGQQDTAPDTEWDAVGPGLRKALGVLLSRVRRGVQTDGEADLLAGHVEHLMRSIDQNAAGRVRLQATAERMKRECDQAEAGGQVDDSSPTPPPLVHPEAEQQANGTAAVGEMPVTVEALAQLLSAADVEINHGDYPTWETLAESGTEEYRKAARYVLKRCHVTAKES